MVHVINEEVEQWLASHADVLRLVTRGGTHDKPKNVCVAVRLNSTRLKDSKYNIGAPPLTYGMGLVCFWPIFKEHVEFELKLFIKLKKQPLTLICNNLNKSSSCQTESRGFLKSTKQWRTNLSTRVLNVRTWSAVQFLGRKPIWVFCRILRELTCSSSRRFKREKNNFPKQLKFIYWYYNDNKTATPSLARFRPCLSDFTQLKAYFPLPGTLN